MTPAQRRIRMAEVLEQREYCTVEYLSALFDVSPMTVRRDLAVLEGENRALRCRGGAGAVKYNEVVAPVFAVREHHGLAEKKELAQYALEKLSVGSAVWIDSSSTAFSFAGFIEPEHGVTVVTNSLRVVGELSHKRVTVYCTGGTFRSAEQAFFGDAAERALAAFRFDAAFLSPRGIVPGEGCYDCTEHEQKLHASACRAADTVYLLCTKSKLGCRYRYPVADSGNECRIITSGGCFSRFPAEKE